MAPTGFPTRRSRRRLIAAAAIALLPSAGALAQVAEPAGTRTYTLTPEEKERLLATSTETSAEAARYRAPPGAGAAAIHGEVGGVIGTNGLRGAYGTAAIPLGDHAGAVVSFENSRFGDDRRRR